MSKTTKEYKICTACGKELHYLEFHIKNSLAGYRKSQCKKCVNTKIREYYAKSGRRSTPKAKARQRELIIKRVYGITTEDYNNLFIEQGGRCAICGKHQEEFKLRLSIDHCHKTGKIRGLLCHRCNGGLGHFDDNVEILENVIKYLEQKEK